jgi:hypothetical protein
MANEEFPSVFSVKSISERVVEVHFNSFSNVQDLASFLSKQLHVPLVINIYQSVATASYWALYLKGECVREIEAGDGVITNQSGILLDFEIEPLGHDISVEGDEPFYIFDDEDQTHYNEKANIPVEVYQDYDSGWKNLILEHTYQEEVSREKPWWKFW